MIPLLDRLADKFTIGDGCWEWTASLNDSGYGQVYVQEKKMPIRAHRVLYELLVGPIPEGLVIDHLCRNRKCVRPDHLEPVTRGENVRRGVHPTGKDNHMGAKTHCKRGHEFTPENTAPQANGKGRQCKACNRWRQRMARKAA